MKLTSKRTAVLIAGTMLAAAILSGCERNPPEYIPAQARGKETQAYADIGNDGPRFIKIKKKDAQSKEAVARRRELKAKIKEKYRRGAFFD